MGKNRLLGSMAVPYGTSSSQAQIRLPSSTVKKPKPKHMHDYLYGVLRQGELNQESIREKLELHIIDEPQNEPNTQERERNMNIYRYHAVTLNNDGEYNRVLRGSTIVASSKRAARDKAVARESSKADLSADLIGDGWDIVIEHVT